MSKRIKVWIFYLVGDEDVYGTSPNEIYAYTTDITTAAQFIDERDMSLFYMKNLKVSRDELNDLYRHHTSSLLQIIERETRDPENPVKTVDFKIALTNREVLACDSQLSVWVNEELCSKALVPPLLFKDKYVKYLVRLMYISNFEYIHNREIIHRSSNTKVIGDYYSIIMENFGDLFTFGKEGEV